MGKRKRAECAYCGEIREITREHVIPKCLFDEAVPFPPNLITVPVCEACNHAKSHNDDFLRDWLTIDIFGNGSPTAQAVLSSSVVRSVAGGHSQIALQVLSEAQHKPLITTGGIYLGEYPSISIDEGRANEILVTIVRGLYHHQYKKRMPERLQYTIRGQYPWDIEQTIEVFRNWGAKRWYSLGKVFSYTNVLLEAPLHFSLWLLCFYEGKLFTVSAMDPEVEKYRHR